MNTLLFILALGSFFLYFPAKEHQVRGHFLKTKWDDQIKPEPIFVVPYIFFFPFVLLTIIWAYYSGNPEFPQLAVAVMATSVITTFIYIVYPSMMIRPFTAGGLIPQTWTEKLMRRIEKFDKPDNVFPSNHVAYSLVVTLFLVAVLPAFAILFWIIFVLIAASTVMIKQHYLVDVLAGAALALGIWLLVGLFL